MKKLKHFSNVFFRKSKFRNYEIEPNDQDHEDWSVLFECYHTAISMKSGYHFYIFRNGGFCFRNHDDVALWGWHPYPGFNITDMISLEEIDQAYAMNEVFDIERTIILANCDLRKAARL